MKTQYKNELTMTYYNKQKGLWNAKLLEFTCTKNTTY